MPRQLIAEGKETRAGAATLLRVDATLRRALKGLDGSGSVSSKGKTARLCTGRKTALADYLFDRRGH